MTMGIKYILDTNVFVQAKNLYYQFHFCPGFWDWLCKLNPNGFLSIKNVYDEICYTNDELKEWVTKQQSFFVDFDNRSATKISEIKKLLDKKTSSSISANRISFRCRFIFGRFCNGT